MCENKRITPNMGTAKISVANGNLNGTGTIVDVITGAANGTFVESVTVKSMSANGQGMVRLFVKQGGGGAYYLLQEIMIPATTPTGVVQSFCATLDTPISLTFGETLAASTENPETFSVIASGYNIAYCDCGRV